MAETPAQLRAEAQRLRTIAKTMPPGKRRTTTVHAAETFERMANADEGVVTKSLPKWGH